MDSIINSINSYSTYILGVMAVIVLLLFILVIVLFKSIRRLEKRYRKLMRGADNKSLEQLIVDQLGNIDEASNRCKEVLAQCDSLETRIKECIQKVAIMRYKAFEDVGSDLSFSIALLDDNNDGVLITSIYGRNESTTYAKPIDKGISRYDLSEEEIYVLDEAVNKNNSKTKRDE